MKTPDIDAVTRGLNPTPSTEVSETAWTELSAGITLDAGDETTRTAPSRTPVRPRLVLAAASLLLIGGVVAATVVNRPGQDLPQAMAVTDHGGSLTVRVVDQEADPKAYNQQFKRLGLDILVRMVPVSPSNAGDYATFLYNTGSDGSQLSLLRPGEGCPATLNASDPGCQYGVQVSKSFKGHAEIEFGRVAKPGETYQASPGEANAPGEELAGLAYRNQRVADVQKLLATRGMTIKSYLNSKTEIVNGVTTAKEVDPAPGDWYVHSIQPDSPGVVMVWIGPRPEK
jgi:hypothetical protein